jgi:uncharacterized membrane protein (UPF0127 family)
MLNKNITIISIALQLFVLCGLGFACFFTLHIATAWQGYRFKVIEIEGKDKKLLIADTPEKHSKGLMNTYWLVGYDGMIFEFSDNKEREFWNKNTYMDLDVLWYQGKDIIGKSQLPSVFKSKDVVKVQSLEPADSVVELVK